ncbi:hypothetical protein PSEUBRA_001329 [Kalmanozyma brasiliensis GHG001]|uniref:Uncharacterized protein n=1 Tax=Kalmanozyma brasiliensis (strain GHG001) TaxID=1365824 RepID=V5EER2_KALBG|nr:uncharacterized protein PSEUBRA_001329 [Kalmanozyma brasiliensis GHG001]EST09001.1 hypothetical protein PSEUBRA_001329 [Kalmanozyma brasiliensis GHG001]
MLLQPSMMPRAPALWERQGPGGGAGATTTTQDAFDSFTSDLFGGADNTDSIVSTASGRTTTTRVAPTTTATTRRTTATTSTSNGLPTPTAAAPTTTSTTTSSTTSSTPTSTSTSSTSSIIITTSSPTTLVSTSLSVSGTSTSQVVVTTVVTPVVTTTSSPNRADANRSSSNGGLIGGIVGGVVGGLLLLALLIALCVFAKRRNSRKGGAGDYSHSDGAWPSFSPQNDHVGASHTAAGVGGAAAGMGALAGAAAADSRRSRKRRDQTSATLPAQFANDDDPERYGYNGSSQAHGTAYNNTAANNYQDYDAYNGYAGNGYPDMQERPARNGATALAAGAAAGGATSYLYNNTSPGRETNRRSSHGHGSYNTSNDGYNTAQMSPNTMSSELAPAPWTLPMMGWQDTHGPYSVAGVGQNLAGMGAGAGPQAQFMVSPSEANVAAAARAARAAPAQTRSPGPDYSHFDPPEVRDARAREAAGAALRGNTSRSRQNSYNATSPRRQSRRPSSNLGSPVAENGAYNANAPPAYVDAQDALEEMDEQPRRLHLTNAEPDVSDESSRGGPSRRPAHNHKDAPPAATYRQN